MASTFPARLVTPRDQEIFAALDRCPLTVRQLLKLSQAFVSPFTSERRLQDRLKLLCEQGWLCRSQLATASPGAPNCYKLSPEGYRYVHGGDTPLPHRRRFAAVAVGRLAHTVALGDFIVHTAVAAHRSGVVIGDFVPENELRLEIGGECLYPDCAFKLLAAGDRIFAFFVELDNGTQSIESHERESWERKISFYERLQEKALPIRFRVLIVSTRRSERIRHILDVAAGLARNPDRSLVYAVGLDDYLRHPAPLTQPCFRDHRGTAVPLVRLPCGVPAVFLRATGALPERVC